MVLAFLGIVLQAFPFLITGVLLSSLISFFVSERFIERHFPKNTAAGIAFALLGGFCLPVCDCVSIPVFRSLVKKGIPLTSAIVFMTAAPVINPVVILSTYYAFNGNVRIVFARVILGIICSALIGLSFLVRAPKNVLLPGEHFGGGDCGCAACASENGGRKTVHAFFEHARLEFFGVGKYLIVGAAFSALLQRLGGKLTFESAPSAMAVSLFIMMALAFLLSLCSSSDAVIGRSFIARFSLLPVLGFLVFGPMLDIKNILMLSGGFTKRFIVRFLITSFTVCFAVLFICILCGAEAWL